MVERSTAMAETLSHHRFSVDDYHRMVEAGILTKDDRVELLHGEIVVMAPISRRHSACVHRLLDVFGGLGTRALKSVQSPVQFEDSEPEPDFALLERREDFYASAHPGPADVFLLVEVAVSSLAVDRGVKLPLYAASGIREFWLVDVEADAIEVHRHPDPESRRYTEVRRVVRGETLQAEAFPDFEVPASKILP
jgi:Uma2 family endonuclease